MKKEKEQTTERATNGTMVKPKILLPSDYENCL